MVTAAQLAALGLTHAALSVRVSAGTLHRLHRGVYAVGHAKLSEKGRYMAAVLAAGEGAVLAGLSAAKLWQAWRRKVPEIHVVVPGNRRLRASFRVQRTRHLHARDFTTHDGIPVTTMARTLVDLTDTLTAPQLANVIHEAAFRKRFDRISTYAAIERANGRRKLHRLLEALQADGAGTKSDLEDRFLELVSELPPPAINTRIAGFEVDFAWPGAVVEIDGPGHTRLRTRREDAIREAGLKRAGFGVIRFTAQDLDDLGSPA